MATLRNLRDRAAPPGRSHPDRPQGPGKVALCRKCDVPLHGYDSASRAHPSADQSQSQFSGPCSMR
jgi:hypothetical protein